MALPALKPEEAYLDDESEGSVFRLVELADGTVEEQQLPLTLELLLHPQEGDKVAQNDFHSRLLGALLERVRSLEPDVAVFTDLIFRWDKLGLPDAAPDVAVVAGLPGTREEITEQVQGLFDVASLGQRPHLAIEVVSPQHRDLRKKDLEINVADYARAGIREYLVVNPGGRHSKAPLQLLGYRLEGGPEYTEIEPDEQGRILSETTGLLFWSDPDGRRLEVFDAATGERVLNAKEARARAEEEAARAEEEAARAEEEAAARKAAEARAKTAETRVEEEKAARKAAEEKIAQLEALLRRQS